MVWRVAKSLNVLLDQINAIAPNRDKSSDGSIGDAGALRHYVQTIMKSTRCRSSARLHPRPSGRV